MVTNLWVIHSLKIRNYIFNVVVFVAFLSGVGGAFQTHGQTYGTPCFTETFGIVPSSYSGNANYYRAPITGRGEIGSAYTYLASGTLNDGQYCLSPNPYYCHVSDRAWLSGADHTAGDVNGLALVVNAALNKGQFYKRAISGLCYNSQFEFRAYYANILSSTLGCNSNRQPINIRFEVWDRNPGDNEANATVPVGGTAVNGAVLLNANSTGNVAANNTLTWRSNVLIFNVPANQQEVYVVLRNNGNGGCGNDLAIDDISFSPYVPFTVDYSVNLNNYCVTNQVILNATLASGTIPAGYVFQWQIADESLNNWTNVGSPIYDFNLASIALNVNSINGKKYRIVSATSVLNFNNSNCYVASSPFFGSTIQLPTATVSGVSDVCGTQNHDPVNTSLTVEYQGNVYPWTYYYRVNGGPEISVTVPSGNTDIMQLFNITDNTTFELIKIQTSDCSGPLMLNLVHTIQYSIGSPGTPTALIGPNPACIGTEADFSVAPVAGAVYYNWIVSGGWSVVSGQGTPNVSILVGSGPISITIETQNACGTNSWTSPLISVTNEPPATPSGITTPGFVCLPSSSVPGSTDVLFESAIVPGAANYYWEWDAPLAYGTQQSGTGQFLRQIILTVPNNSGSFQIRVTAQNDCGYSPVRVVTFNLSHYPEIFNIGGGGVFCYGGSGSTITLSGSETGVSYTLYKNSVSTGISLPGTGSPLSFANVTEPGNYTIIGNNSSCSSNMNGDVDVAFSQEMLLQFTDVMNVRCFGESGGSVTAVTSGGTIPYSYIWSTVPPQYSQTATGLAAGIYSVTVSDANGCLVSGSTEIVQPNLLIASETHTQVPCFGSTADVSINAIGGTPPYIGTGIFTQHAGTQTYSVTDANGCITTIDVTIAEGPRPVIAQELDLPGPVHFVIESGQTLIANICSGQTVTFNDITSPSLDPSPCGPLMAEVHSTTTISTMLPTRTFNIVVSSVEPPYNLTPVNPDGIAKDVNIVITPYYDSDGSGTLTTGDVTGQGYTVTINVKPATTVSATISGASDVCGTPSYDPVSTVITINYTGNIFPWTYFYKINGGPELSGTVLSGNTELLTISITGNTTFELVRIETNECTPPANFNLSHTIIYSIGAPAMPADITANFLQCLPSYIPGSTDVVFEASYVPGAISYNWQWDPPVTLGTQQSGTGQGYQRIVLSIPNNITFFNVKVSASNNCGTSPERVVTFNPY